MAERLTEADLDAIIARVDAAPPGPWAVDLSGWAVTGPGLNICALHDGRDSTTWPWDGPSTGQGPEAAAFIAHARTDVPLLIACIAEVMEVLADLACTNCGDRQCMRCVIRDVHDDCCDDCPQCCGDDPWSPAQRRRRDLLAAWFAGDDA